MSALAETPPPAARPSAAADGRTGLIRWLLRGLARYLLLPACLLAGIQMVVSGFTTDHGVILYDFHGGMFNAGLAILHGHNPYWPRFLAHQLAIMHAGGIALGETANRAFSIPVYPAGANLAILPLSLLPWWLAGSLWTVLCIVAMLGGIRLLGVHDWRCLGLIAVSFPFVDGLYLGAIGPLLVLGAAVAWRWRERLWPPALAVASLVALKIFPWTLGGWLLVTRRYRALALAVVACAAITFGAWAAIGWHGLVQYPQMLSQMSELQEGRAVSVVTVLVFVGVPPSLASAAAIGLALVILAFGWRVARRPDGDRQAFSLAILAALTGTPIVWDHYMVLLFVPIALYRPRFSRVWLVPVVTPVLGQLWYGLLPHSMKVAQAHQPAALATALPWLAAEALLGAWVVTTPEQRRALLGRLAARLRPTAAAPV